MRTFKKIGEDINNLAPITNKATFLAALPLLVEMRDRIENMRKCITRHGVEVKELNEACSAYALDHVPSVFVNGLVTDGKGVKHGDVDVDGKLYHFSAGYGKLIRSDGDNVTQEFLDDLPEKWLKSKLELDETAIKKLGVTSEELLEKGLAKSANNRWSLPDAGDSTCESE